MRDDASPSRDIRFSFSTIDRFSESRRFKTVAGAKRYVAKRIGSPYGGPVFGYLVDAYGIGKLTLVSGATWAELGYTD